MLRFKIKSFLKFVTVLHVSAYSAIIRCIENTHLTTLRIYSTQKYSMEKILTQFIITHYRDNTYGIEGGTTLTSLTDCSSIEGTAVPPEF
jgi:hypothetical protein